MKISDRNTLLRVLKENGFTIQISGKRHDKFSNSSGKTVSVPRQHSSGKFSRFCSQNILKCAGINYQEK